MTSDGKPFGNALYESIVKERYIISNNLSTSYTDTANITPLERKLLLNFIIEDLKKRKELVDESRMRANQR